MGKAGEEQSVSTLPPPPGTAGENAGPRCPQCRPIGKIVRLRCVAALALGIGMLLSAVFWLPPFLRHGKGSRSWDRDPNFGADIVASFKLQKPVSLLKANVVHLQYDIFEEIGVPNSSVVIMSLEPVAGLNSTNVVFCIWPYPMNSTISSTGLSILRASFMSLVIQQSTLHLTTSLFGNSSNFQVLKFSGGITIIPPQSVFLLQKVNSLFNFTLNFPIDQVQDKISELKEQMKFGLSLNSYENLYVRLTNANGSTVAPPTVVQTYIVLAVGNHQPSMPRLKQLAQTIASSSGGNLGLNHTVFGRVKQIQLSSYLQHSLNSGGGSSSLLSPSPAPQPHLEHHHHRRHHHHHHHRHSDMHLVPAPAPQDSYRSPAPGYHAVAPSKPKSIVPDAAPVVSPQHSSAPRLNEDPPAPTPQLVPASPLSAVIFAHARPPSQSVTDFKHPDRTPSISPSSFSSSVACHPSARWVLALATYFLMLL